jgi:Asp-tRNA(Asn)/Glu-tRNA(Gln) amidotransferase A subunit family amidase
MGYFSAAGLAGTLLGDGSRPRRAGRVDVFVTPSYAPDLLLTTNLTGHPVVVLPAGFTDEGSPVGVSFVGGLWKEAEALRVAKAYQDATGFHERHSAVFAPGA